MRDSISELVTQADCPGPPGLVPQACIAKPYTPPDLVDVQHLIRDVYVPAQGSTVVITYSASAMYFPMHSDRLAVQVMQDMGPVRLGPYSCSWKLPKAELTTDSTPLDATSRSSSVER